MKYTKEQYLNCNYYEITSEEINHKNNVVKSRKERTCVICRNKYPAGTWLYFESCILEGTGRVSSYTCLNCLDQWIDQIGVDNCG